MLKMKIILAYLCGIFGISDRMLEKLNKRLNNQYIRILNYHDTAKKNAEQLERHLQWYRENYRNVNYEEFELFMESGTLTGEKPGLMITFDDGYEGNYGVAAPLLEKYGFTGYFMCSSALAGKKGYMNYDELRELVERGHVIGAHTATHHRMLKSDSEDTLRLEIVESKKALEKELRMPADIFCWCGGEEEHYTKRAYEVMKNAGYKYAFMTNSEPVTGATDALYIQRTNIEDNWEISLVKLQVCGFMDKRFAKKRTRVNNKLTA